MKTAVVYLFVLGGMLILLGANIVAAATYNAVELKVYNSNTGEVYYDKVIPKDQKSHVTLTIDGDRYDITYDPNKTGVSRSLSCSGGTCTNTITIGPSSSAITGPIVVKTTPVTAPRASAPIPVGVHVLGALILSVAFLRKKMR